MTLQTAQDNIAILMGEDVTPTVGSTTWNTRLKFINLAINDWATEEGMLWNELFKNLADASDGDKTTDGVKTVFACPSDFLAPGGFVQTVDSNGNATFYDVRTPEWAHLYKGDTLSNFCWFTGPSGSVELNFLNAPESGLTLAYPYYKTETYLVNATDTFEMHDPNFCVYRTAENLHLGASNYFSYNTFGQKAQDSMQAMKTFNKMTGHFQSQAIPDDSEGFGY